MNKYHDFIFGCGSISQEDKHDWTCDVVPVGLRNAAEKMDVLYMSKENWIEAQRLAASFFATLICRKRARQHARYVLKRLERDDDPRLYDKCVRAGGLGYNSVGAFTIFSVDGRVETGSMPELSRKTGVPYDRIRDICRNGERYAYGWCLSREEAAKGKQKPGPKKKLKAMATEGTEWF